MHKSNSLKLLKSWEHCFSRAVQADELQQLDDPDRETLVLGLTLWAGIYLDIMSQIHSLDAAASTMANAKAVLKAEGALNFREFQSSLERLDAGLVRRGKISKRDVRQAVKYGWLRKMLYHVVDAPLRDIHELCQFAKRLTLHSDPALKETAEVSYFDNIRRIREVNASCDFTDEEVGIIAEWAESYENPEWADLAWGNGQVAQQLKSTSRWRKVANHRDSQLSRYAAIQLLGDSRREFHWYFGKIPDIGVPAKPGRKDMHYTNCVPPKGRLEFVPKSYKTYRSICMEDLSVVPYQQAVFRAMDRWFRSTLSSHIDLQDQARSRALAMIGSKHPELYATIDLSMASDSVSTGLVRKWLWATKLRDSLYATRSAQAKYLESEFELPMFAAMGSACCFPLECLVFAAQCEATIRSVADPLKEVSAPSWYVYGDDIVIETAYAPALIQRLRRNGFLVNEEKSFVDSDCYFREACGGEYYAGEDVTPVRLPRNFTARLTSKPKVYDHRRLASWYYLSNAFAREGFFTSRRFLLQELTARVPRELIPWTNDTSVILMTDGNRTIYEHVRRAKADYWVRKSIPAGFGWTSRSDCVYTNAPVKYPNWDEGLQKRYREVIGSVLKHGSYRTVRGQLISNLSQIREMRGPEMAPPYFGDQADSTTVVVDYE